MAQPSCPSSKTSGVSHDKKKTQNGSVGARHWSTLGARCVRNRRERFACGVGDLLAVSEILGHKKFLFGEKPCLADAALFAFIAAFTWESPESPFALLTKSKAKNLDEHVKRMKELYYPDWDEIISKKHKSG